MSAYVKHNQAVSVDLSNDFACHLLAFQQASLECVQPKEMHAEGQKQVTENTGESRRKDDADSVKSRNIANSLGS
jgi:hypothetical protein